jgi:Arc/MetJ-type ribon-helix-helix transcriptional regulator
MQIEIHTPELEQRVRRQIQSGHYHDADELLTKALDALDEKAAPISSDERTGADLIAALQSSPYRELDIEPPRYREAISVRDIVL